MKLFTIGDSISQGFMSLAAARTDLSYSALIAQAMGCQMPGDYWFPDWPQGGHPANLELLVRRIERVAGTSINLLEWPLVIHAVSSFLDLVEDHYERGPGRVGLPDPTGQTFCTNVSSRGFSVADAWQVTPELCLEEIRRAGRTQLGDGTLSLPSAGFYRTALKVLNPGGQDGIAKFGKFSALDWLAHHHADNGVDNLFLWLGANNALGTIVSMEIKATNDPRRPYDPSFDHRRRAEYNLWSPEHFEADYAELLERVYSTMKTRDNDWQVFVATVPAVTIAPLAKGVVEAQTMPDPFGVLKDGAEYYKYYTYVLFEDEAAHDTELKLTRQQAYTIDSYIAAYNQAILALVDKYNAKLRKKRFHVVDMCTVLLQAAYKRNRGMPTYNFPPEVSSRYPMVDTRYFHATSRGELEQGGIFSLDGVHPSAIGHGLIAHEFLNVLNDVRGTSLTLDWAKIYAADALFMDPPRLMPSARKQRRLAKLLIDIVRAVGLRN